MTNAAVSITRLVRTAMHCYLVITVVLGCIAFIDWEELVAEGGLKNDLHYIWLVIEFLKYNLTGKKIFMSFWLLVQEGCNHVNIPIKAEKHSALRHVRTN